MPFVHTQPLPLSTRNTTVSHPISHTHQGSRPHHTLRRTSIQVCTWLQMRGPSRPSLLLTCSHLWPPVLTDQPPHQHAGRRNRKKWPMPSCQDAFPFHPSSKIPFQLHSQRSTAPRPPLTSPTTKPPLATHTQAPSSSPSTRQKMATLTQLRPTATPAASHQPSSPTKLRPPPSPPFPPPSSHPTSSIHRNLRIATSLYRSWHLRATPRYTRSPPSER